MTEYRANKIHQLFADSGYDLTKRPQNGQGRGCAPVNWALAKYWGKRDRRLNLPAVSSLSVAVPFFTNTAIKLAQSDDFVLNDKRLDKHDRSFIKLFSYLDFILGPDRPAMEVVSHNTISTGTGLASSASGFAACVLALNNLYGWNMSPRYLSILARIGSGSACRSIYPGFVIWDKGKRDDGMDSFAVPFTQSWPELRLALLEISKKTKPLGSTKAMELCALTSPLYPQWLDTHQNLFKKIKQAIIDKDLQKLVYCAQENALFMHEVIRASETMEDGTRLDYFLEGTRSALKTIEEMRGEGITIGGTMDAGPQVKLIFHKNDTSRIRAHFPQARIMEPYFADNDKVLLNKSFKS